MLVLQIMTRRFHQKKTSGSRLKTATHHMPPHVQHLHLLLSKALASKIPIWPNTDNMLLVLPLALIQISTRTLVESQQLGTQFL
jgi:hypothetical protein